MNPWYESYIGKPWQAVPDPPDSFTCGELVRYIHKQLLGINCPEILADALNTRSCVRAMQPERYNLRQLEAQERPVEFDVVFLMRASMQDHVGIGVNTLDGLQILHCLQGAGVILNTMADLRGFGFRGQQWYRHRLREGE